ncbi:MAG: hypothetical protein FD145_1258 [Candidatus Saganbacteria bacterium]|uniref:Peptidase MA-like domain-containing protein n=1 Tax=Candidatus Saganbacteria bacterium TaxID=2575572 RepID=A0A833L088_UNCSA|nr:MAG: hypothetical protein FD145_1258 [Candidatus Saganbacteria bacterium]
MKVLLKNRKTILFFLLVFFVVCISISCGRVLRKSIELKITAFLANKTKFNITVANNGTDITEPFAIKFALDDIYVEAPENKTISIEKILGNSHTTTETDNLLSSSDGIGGHCATAYVEGYGTEESVYYNDGNYQTEYDYAFANLSNWLSNIKSTLKSDYDFPCSGTYNVHLVDAITSESGSSLGKCSGRTIKGSYTAVIQLSLSDMNSYGTYFYDGVHYPYTTSQEVAYHEYTHAFHREYIISKSSLSDWSILPSWFKEGLAVYSAGQGIARVRYYSAYYKTLGYTKSQMLDKILSAVNGGDHEAHDYAGDYLAVYYIRYTYGKTVLNNVIKDNAGGMDIEDAIVHNLSSVSSFASFKSKVRDYAENYVDNIWNHLYSTAIRSLQIKEVERKETD